MHAAALLFFGEPQQTGENILFACISTGNVENMEATIPAVHFL
jgi:hypothetical protein